MARRPHPHISIPPGAAPPTNASPAQNDDWGFLITPPDKDTLNLWNEHDRNSTFTPLSPETARPYPGYPLASGSSRPPSRAASVHESGSPRLAFPEPQPYIPNGRASLRSSASHSRLGHRSSKSETHLHPRPSVSRGESRPPSFISTESSPELASTALSDDLSSLTVTDEASLSEALRRFQAGSLADADEEWHRLVPPVAREVLDHNEVTRQSVLFEIIKSERDYVRDLELVRDVYIDPLVNTSPIPQARLKGFVSEVFYNLDEILVHHRRMLDKLFARQREQHPLIQSVADIVLDTSIAFRGAYEAYIKHYPISEAHHRKELRRNPKYQNFLSQCSQDPRVRKRDLITFLSRPVTRLPRLNLLLENAKKHTPAMADHPDQRDLPLILDMLSAFIKSTQPGIEAAESKVKFWGLCESLAYQKGEIIDLDLYDEKRTLMYASQLARRYKAEVGYNWADLYVALLDSYLLLLKPEFRASGVTRYNVVSRPIPLEYLRLMAFDAVPENRKEKAHSSMEQTRIFESFRSRYRAMYPFTVFHASATSIRRYTLYAASDAERERWHKALSDAIALRKISQDNNKWFAPERIVDGFFKFTSGHSSNGRATGKIRSAVLLGTTRGPLFAVGCPSGIYVGTRTTEFRRVLKMTNVISLHALPEYNKVLVHSDEGLDAYSLDIMARVGLGTGRPQDLDASREKVSGQDVAVVFARVERIGGRTMVLYATKSFLQVTLYSLEVLHPTEAAPITPRRSIVAAGGAISFRPFSEAAWIPKDSHDITALHKSIGICTERGIHVVDPTNLNASSANSTVIPVYNDPHEPMQTLRQRCSSARPLGLVKVSSSELLVIFDELGCYIDRRGVPVRSSGYLRWETKATAFAHRGEHILLFSSEFIEIRSTTTGKLVQVIEGEDMRLVHASDRAILVAMRSEKEKDTDKLVEFVETADLVALQKQNSLSNSKTLWEEWDMQ